MHHRGGGIGHTTGHNAEAANQVPSHLHCSGLGRREGSGADTTLDEDISAVEALVEEVQHQAGADEVNHDSDGQDAENEFDDDDSDAQRSDFASDRDDSDEDMDVLPAVGYLD